MQEVLKSGETLQAFLDRKVEEFNRVSFIKDDPVSIPHQFSLKQDIEISGFFAALFAWGQRATILNKCHYLLSLMDEAPYEFVKKAREPDLARLKDFKHRTFMSEDIIYLISFLQDHYLRYDSLEDAFLPEKEESLAPLTIFGHFHDRVFSLREYPQRTKKHIADPRKNSSCKRLAMFLRWMVRKDNKDVDFGIWNRIGTENLLCPLDLHVHRTARKLGLVTRRQADFKTAMELTEQLKKFNPKDPVKYDYALFGLSVNGEK